MSRPLAMTPELAMRAVATLRDALAAIDKGELPEGSLIFIVMNAVHPHELDEVEIAAAEAEMARIMQTTEW